MTDLTEQDKKNYSKLQEAFKLLKIIDANGQESQDTTINSIKTSISIDTIPQNTDELLEKINSLDIFLGTLSILKKEIKFSNQPEENQRLEQQFLDSINKLKQLLKVVKNKKLDLTSDIEEFYPDSLFFDFIKNIPPNVPNPQTWTKILIENRKLNLTEEQINQLIQAWGTAVNSFVDDASKKNEKIDGKVTPLQPETFAHFFRIHKELEVLYSRLADTSTAQNFR